MSDTLLQAALRLIELIYGATLDISKWSIFLAEFAKVIEYKSDLRCLTGEHLVPEDCILQCAKCPLHSSCLRHDLNESEVTFIKLITPHVTRAVQIRHQINSGNQNQDLLREFINCCASGVIIVERSGEIFSINSRAQELVTNDDILIKGNMLEFNCSSDTVNLHRLISETSKLTPYRMVSGSFSTVLNDGNKLKILVVPLGANTQFSSVNLANKSAIFLCNTAIHLTREQVIACFGLSNTESNLVVNLVEGLSLDECAKKLKITYSTARTYLKHIFVKLGIKRQSELAIHIFTSVLWHLPQESSLNNFRKIRRNIYD